MHSSAPRIRIFAQTSLRAAAVNAGFDFTGGIVVIRIILIALVLTLASCASVPESSSVASAASLVDAETGFARSMADRDFAAFGSFIDEQAVFINGGKPLRGKQEILNHWQAFFVGAEAPFAWKPVMAEVSASNGLGYTEGPVQLPDGSIIATFYSTWQLKSDGTWKVVFDNGYDACECRQSQ